MGDRASAYQLTWDAYRAMHVGTYRHAYAQMYINDVFYGLMGLEERLDNNWAISRYNVDTDKQASICYANMLL
jgi:hypothetical protein